MSKGLIIASNNAAKIKEIRQLLPHVPLQSLKEIGFAQEIPEPYMTFEENAAVKAKTIYEHSNVNTFADDSGICVPALDNAPGVHSARYAGADATDVKNLQRLLADMEHIKDRRAYYKAVICLVWNGEEHYFDGTCHGRLATAPSGNRGFGYDPIFIPEGYQQTFGELSADVKNKLSHRGEAIRKMVKFIEEQN